jgi:NitT/TauT family transport system substrate-binding protein
MIRKSALFRTQAGMLALIAGCACTLTACAGGSNSASAEGSGCNGQEVSVGITNSASDAPFYVADEQGYFKDAGLKVKFNAFDSAAKMIAPLGAGQLDVGAGAPSAGFYNAVSRDVNMRIVADKGSMPEHYGYMPLMVRKDLVDSGKVKDIADLKGLKVAEPAPATATASTLATILDSAGLAYDDVSHEYIGFGEQPAAFQNGAIDAAMITEPSATIAEQQGAAVRLASPTDYYDNQQLAVLLYSDDFASKDTEAAQCFMDAYVKGARDYDSAFVDGKLTGTAGDEIASIVTKATGLDEELYRKIVPNYVDPNGAVNVESLKKDYDFFEQHKLLEGSADVDKIVDSSFAEKAASTLGDFKANG